jgi:hypothetical protein
LVNITDWVDQRELGLEAERLKRLVDDLCRIRVGITAGADDLHGRGACVAAARVAGRLHVFGGERGVTGGVHVVVHRWSGVAAGELVSVGAGVDEMRCEVGGERAAVGS